MVLNCEAAPERRGRMIEYAARALRKGGLLLLSLPRACVDNSRFCSRKAVLLLARSLGLKTLRVSASPRLVWEASMTPGAFENKAGKKRPGAALRSGDGRNNFKIVLTSKSTLSGEDASKGDAGIVALPAKVEA
ncbi:hypothetical protein T484DRAFT_1936312 [Baffinella frigidus]|nr:hypothetical protein T484DRAFT_1936312 [Cryptophyta sp. CCMP2293]